MQRDRVRSNTGEALDSVRPARIPWADRKLRRRAFLTRTAGAGVALAALYAVPKLNTVQTVAAYSAITGPCKYHATLPGIPSFPIWPIAGTSTVQGFYNYDNTKSASAYTGKGLEVSGRANFFLYCDGDGDIHLVTILDKWNDGSGGAAHVKYSGLPAGAAWSVRDDPHSRDWRDHYYISGSTALGKWQWNACCTDGGALSGGFNTCGWTVNLEMCSALSNIDCIRVSYPGPSGIQFTEVPVSGLSFPIKFTIGATS